MLENLLCHTEGRIGEEFPGSGGSALLSTVLASEGASKLQFMDASPPATSAAAASGSAANGSGAGSLPAALRARLTVRQQQAVGQLLRVRSLVAQFVARHDEERLQVRWSGWGRSAAAV